MTDARLKPRRPQRVQHPWIFAGEIASLPAAAADGEVVRVLDHRARFYATAYLNRRSKIALRVLSWHDEEINDNFWRARVGEALALRGALAADSARRLVNAEGDRLPGLIVDFYAGWLVVQISTLGMDRMRTMVVEALRGALMPHGIYERSDVPERSLEGLEQRTGTLYGSDPPEVVEISEGRSRLLVDIAHGQKTGLFLDQRLNRQAAGEYARDRRVLNCFGYSGGFSVHACLGGAREVVTIDISAEACRLALRNLALNGCANPHVVEANCFDWLRAASDNGERFGMVVLDPPAFARGRSSLDNALRGYKEINLRALKLLEPGGYLVTCSCSRPVTHELFAELIADAARDAGRDVQLLEDRGQPPDHPVLLAAPETRYLKCLIVRVDGTHAG
ncbi:MAG: class I SAM-dependent rRNA methyltransferase [Candidatus Eremiobacteraeota bacterium]|nr:class I SAM-dependent rRNA methyltransferase [Candidatus Eremiobacteraeota bacterium]